MATMSAREYSCKDEELPVICKFAAYSLNRDLADFTAYSPKFKPAYLTGFESNIATALDVIEPQSETMEQKAITSRIYSTLDGLIDPINRLTGYLKLADGSLGLSPHDFGVKHLRKSINAKDAEGAMNGLHTVNGNITKYKEALMAQGLTEDLIARFANAASAIASDKQKQFELISNRKNIVQNNLTLFNNLYAQLGEIHAVGKILYKSTNTAKLKEYTFSELKKRVRRTAKPVAEEQKVVTDK